MTASNKTSLRSHMIGAVHTLPEGTEVTLCGWITERVHSLRGKLAVPHQAHTLSDIHRVELADRSGKVALHCLASTTQQTPSFELLRPGDVVRCTGNLLASDTSDVKALSLQSIQRLSAAEKLPFDPWHEKAPPTDVRLRYRYLDLRRAETQERLAIRSSAFHSIRSQLLSAEFIEVETPLLERYSAANTSAFIVPWTGGECFSLPQSPQLYKQLLMVGGCDRYFQFARSFRRETGLSAHRKLEFTALDLEMSFVDEEDIFHQTECVLNQLWSLLCPGRRALRFERLSWDKAMEHYGTDSPDLRYDLRLHNITALALQSTSNLFHSLRAQAYSPGASVVAIRLPQSDAQRLTNVRLDSLPMMNPHPRMVNIAWMQLQENTDSSSSQAVLRFEGSIGEAFNAPALEVHVARELVELTHASQGDILVVFFGVNHHFVTASAAEARACLAKELNLVKDADPIFVWVNEYPFWEYDLDSLGFRPARHPFTLPMQEHADILQEIERLPYLPTWNGHGIAPSTGILQERATLRYEDESKRAWRSMRTHGYELSLNGLEVGTGSLRVHTQWQQERIFSMFGYYYEEVFTRFGALMASFAAGMPPHGGISLGIDRILSALTGTQDIDDWTAFPKDTRGTCPMTGAPSAIDNTLLRMTLGMDV